MRNKKAVGALAALFTALSCLAVFGLWKLGELLLAQLPATTQLQVRQAQALVLKQTGVVPRATGDPLRMSHVNQGAGRTFVYDVQLSVPNLEAYPQAPRRPFEVRRDFYAEPWSSTQAVADPLVWRNFWCLRGGETARRVDADEALRVETPDVGPAWLRSWPLAGAAGQTPALRLLARADHARRVVIRCSHPSGLPVHSEWTVELLPKWNEFVLASAPLTEPTPLEFSINVGGHQAPVEFALLETGTAGFSAAGFEVGRNFIERRYNSRANRDREYPLARPAGTLRIVCVGDSFTEGTGVRAEETFAKQLEALLVAEEQGPVESINCGVVAASPPQYAAKFLSQDILYQPQVAIVALCRNDYETPELRQQWKEQAGDDFDAFDKLAREYALSTGFMPALKTLVPMIARCREQGIHFVLVAFQTDNFAEGARMDLDAAEFAAEQNVAYLNPARALAAAGLFGQGSTCSPTEWHPNAAVHNLLAEELVELLKTQGILDAARPQAAAPAASPGEDAPATGAPEPSP